MEKRISGAFLILCLCLLVVAIPGYGETMKEAEILRGLWKGRSIEYIDREILVGLKSGKTQQQFTDQLGSLPVEIVRPADRLGFLKLRVEKDHDLFDLIDQVGRLPSVRYAEPNMVDHLFVIPSDPDFDKQWHYHNTGQSPPGGTPDADIDAPEGWDITRGSPHVKVGVLDSGIPIDTGGFLMHPDLDDVTRFLYGWDFVDDDAGPDDENGHGTHVTGTIAAETDNDGEGGAGVSWNATILAIKVFDAYGQGTHERFRDGCIYAADHECRIINYSGGGGSSSTKEWGVAYADTHDVLLCAAAGNENGGAVLWPAAYSPQYSNVIAVSATDHNDQFAAYSSQGPEVNVSAPGGHGAPADADDVYSTTLPMGYGYKYGTSMACPHVAGLAALMLTLSPGLNPVQVRTIIANTADDLGPAGFDNQYGWGRINVYQALFSLRPPVPSHTQWSLVVIVLLLVTAGAILMYRRRRAMA